MIPTKSKFFNAFKRSESRIRVEYARVEAFTDRGEPLLVFHGEQSVSQKVYPRLRSYDDARIGDRVILINGIIQGARA